VTPENYLIINLDNLRNIDSCNESMKTCMGLMQLQDGRIVVLSGGWTWALILFIMVYFLKREKDLKQVEQTVNIY